LACTYRQGVYLENNTKEKLIINAEFETKYGIDVLNFELDPGGYDAWEYESRYSDKNKIDKSLKMLTIKNAKGCGKNFLRGEIGNLAAKRGMWEIHINEKIIGCE
jgi:hypothetical protein